MEPRLPRTIWTCAHRLRDAPANEERFILSLSVADRELGLIALERQEVEQDGNIADEITTSFKPS